MNFYQRIRPKISFISKCGLLILETERSIADTCYIRTSKRVFFITKRQKHVIFEAY